MSSGDSGLAISVLKTVDSLADQFENSWRSGGEPRIEDWLARAAPDVRPILLRELLGVELEFRARQYETFTAESYLSRFSDWTEIVEQVLAAWAVKSGAKTTSGALPEASRETEPERVLPSEAGGRRIGKFEVHETLGRGAFASVHRAYDTALGRWVALKVPHGSTDAELRRRFVTEARAAARIRHRNVVTVYECGTADGTEYIACELVDGPDLARKVRDERPGLRQLVTYVHDAARGLAHAHCEGVIHRDVKPGNLLVAGDGRVLVSDFGLARRMDDQSSMTVDGTIFGTPAYMSPEQAAGRTRDVGSASDQYSLGIVLYEFLAGRPPFRGTIPQLLQQIVNSDPPAPRSLNPKVPADLEAVCLKSIAHDVQDRYQDVSAFADDLQRWLDGESVTARPLQWRQRIWRRMRRSPRTTLAVGLAAASILVASAAATWGTWQGALAESATQRASTAESAVETQSRTIAEQRTELTASRIEVQSAITEADHNRYRVLVRQAAELVREGQAEPAAIRALLEKCSPALREWEWYYFHNLVREPSRILFDSKFPLCSAVLNSDEGQLAIIDQTGNIRIVDLASGATLRSWESQVPAAIQIDWHWPTQRIVAGGKVTGLRIWNSATERAETALIDAAQVFSGIYSSRSDGSPPVAPEPVSDAESGRTVPQPPTDASAMTRAYFGHENLPAVPPRGHWESQALLAGSSLGWSAAFDPAGERVAVGTAVPAGQGRLEVHVWNVRSGQRQQVLRIDGGSATPHRMSGGGLPAARQSKFAVVSALSFNADGSRLAAGASSGQLRVWNTADWSLIRTITMPVPLSTLAWSSDGEYLFVPRDERHVVRLSSSETSSPEPASFAIPERRGGVTALALSAGADWLATGGHDGCIRLWHVPTRELREEYYAHSSAPIWIRFSPDGRQLISCTSSAVVVWSVRNPFEVRPVPMPESPRAVRGDVAEVAVSSDDRLLATRETFGFTKPDQLVVREQQPQAGSELKPLEVHLEFNRNFSLTDLQFDRRGRWLAAATNGLVQIWDTATWQPVRWRIPPEDVRRLAPESEAIPDEGRTADRIWSRGTSLAFNEEGTQFAFGEQTGHLGIVSTADWTLQKLLFIDDKFQEGPEVVAFCPGKRTLAAGWRRSGLVRLIDLDGGYGIRHLDTHNPVARELPQVGLRSLAFDPGGERLLTSTDDAAIRIWNVRTGALERELLGHTRPADQLVYHPQRNRLFSRGSDQTVRIWDPDAGLEIVSLYSASSKDSISRIFLTNDDSVLNVVINKQIHPLSALLSGARPDVLPRNGK